MNDIKKNLATITSLEEGLLDKLLGRATRAGSKASDDVRIEPRLGDEPAFRAGSKLDNVRIEPEAAQITADPAKVREYIRQGMKPQQARLQALDDAAKAAKETPAPLGSGLDSAKGEYLPAWQRTKAPFSQYREKTVPGSDEIEKVYKYGLGARAAGQALRAGGLGLKAAAKPVGFAVKHPFITGAGYLTGGSELERQGYLEPGATVGSVKSAGEFLGNVGGTAFGLVAPAAVGAAATGLSSVAKGLEASKKKDDQQGPQPGQRQNPETGQWYTPLKESTSSIDKLVSEYKNFLDRV